MKFHGVKIWNQFMENWIHYSGTSQNDLSATHLLVKNVREPNHTVYFRLVPPRLLHWIIVPIRVLCMDLLSRLYKIGSRCRVSCLRCDGLSDMFDSILRFFSPHPKWASYLCCFSLFLIPFLATAITNH